MIRAILLGILLLLVARAFWRLIDGIIDAAGGKPARNRPATAVPLVRDPVCGTFVSPRTSLSLTSGRTTFYFCSDACRDSFTTQRSDRRS